MKDQEFIDQVKAREIGFYSGDLFRVLHRTTQKIQNAKLTTTHEIVRVIEPMASITQQRFNVG